MGPTQKRLLKFCIDYRGWHTLASGVYRDRVAVLRLAEYGFVDITRHPDGVIQFRLHEKEETNG